MNIFISVSQITRIIRTVARIRVVFTAQCYAYSADHAVERCLCVHPSVRSFRLSLSLSLSLSRAGILWKGLNISSIFLLSESNAILVFFSHHIKRHGNIMTWTALSLTETIQDTATVTIECK